MLMGMTFGGTLFVQAVRSIEGLNLGRMVGGMMTGMVWGMVISVALYRLYFSLNDYVLMRKRLSLPTSPSSQ